ncbi:unnamed protein product [Coffea canephora]|uniref:Late embryogenesis abundant protein LEA-2 subgroup domain-containing protein n=1 Tax=Coffea canephora TaxID=49390 RepID=A0A068VE86_COFCA|nr:unnamed protein product [Coffea canephora]
MTDYHKVHPAGESSSSLEQPAMATTVKRPEKKSSEAPLLPAGSAQSSSPSSPPPAEKPLPAPPGTYVIQVPKDQIFSYPPPENASNFQKLSSRKPRRSCCRLCVCYTVFVLFLVIVAAAISAGVLYLVYRPKAPKYAVLDVAIRGLNSTSTSAMSPEFDVSIRAENPNKKIGIYYLSGSEIQVSHGDVGLSNGAWPVFYQPSKNVTVFQTALKGSDVVLSDDVRLAMANELREGNVPFRLNIKAPVKIKVGSVKTWKITVKVKCDVAVDALNQQSKIVSKDCDYSVKLW